MDNLNKIIAAQREALAVLNNDNNTSNSSNSSSNKNSTNSQKLNNTNINNSLSAQQQNLKTTSSPLDLLDFNLFCVISAYLSVLQQEIHESGCISPIKGTNVPPPPVYLSNLQGKILDFSFLNETK